MEQKSSKTNIRKILIIAVVAVIIIATLAIIIIIKSRTNTNTNNKQQDMTTNEEQSYAPVVQREKQDRYIDTLKIGDTITFGSYTINNEWIILDKDGDKLFILKKESAVEPIQYNYDYYASISQEELPELSNDNSANHFWETNPIREWLNTEYLESFSEDERDRILLTHVINDDNPDYGTEGGADTDDYIFLLSVDEARKYITENEYTCYLTTEKTSTFTSQISNFWWLRTPGEYNFKLAIVGGKGILANPGIEAVGTFGRHAGMIRPAMWIDASGLDGK